MADNIVNGMDLDKLEAFRSAIKENPIILGLDARSVWEGHSGRSTVHIGPYNLGGQQIDRETRHIIPFPTERGVKLKNRLGLLVQLIVLSQWKWLSVLWRHVCATVLH